MKIRYRNALSLDRQPFEFFVDGSLIAEPGPSQETIDCQGATVLPAFMESHAHVIPAGLDLLKLNLSSCQSREEVLDAVRDASKEGEGWLHAVQYDQTKFPGAEHLTCKELDLVSSGRPVLLRHSNGHASVANSLALEQAGVTESVEDPSGGTYGRDASGRLNGVLLEHAHEYVTNRMPFPTRAEMVEAILRISDVMARDGITTATDMMTGRWNVTEEILAYSEAARKGAKVRLRLYCQWTPVLGPRGLGAEKFRELAAGVDSDGCRVMGLKLFADGAIGSATAAIYGKYATTGESGALIYKPEELLRRVLMAHEAGFKVAVHAIGDRATDVVLDAFDATGEPARHRIEHAMILSDDQVDRLASNGCHLSMQPEFLIRFGHAYRAQIPDLAPKLNRYRSLLDRGMRMSFSSDRPIIPGAPIDGIFASVNRPEGFEDAENLSLAEAVDLYTVAGNDANDEPVPIGTFKPGSNADWQVYPDGFVPGVRPSQVFRAGHHVCP